MTHHPAPRRHPRAHRPPLQAVTAATAPGATSDRPPGAPAGPIDRVRDAIGAAAHRPRRRRRQRRASAAPARSSLSRDRRSYPAGHDCHDRSTPVHRRRRRPTGCSSADPLALLIGFALDQQVTVQKAFSGPAELQRRIGHLDAARIAAHGPRGAGRPSSGRRRPSTASRAPWPARCRPCARRSPATTATTPHGLDRRGRRPGPQAPPARPARASAR